LEGNTIKSVKSLSSIVLLLLLLSLLSGCLELPIDDNNNGNGSDGGEDFVFTTVNSNVKHLSDYRGKVVIMDMWAIWCGPCLAQMLEFEKIYGNYSRGDLEIISINIESTETLPYIQDFLANPEPHYPSEYHGYNFDFDWVFGNDDGSVWEEYQMPGRGIPTIYIFDQNGTVYYSEEGYHPYSSLVEKIDELLD